MVYLMSFIGERNDELLRLLLAICLLFDFKDPPPHALGNPEARENTDAHSFKKPGKITVLCSSLWSGTPQTLTSGVRVSGSCCNWCRLYIP